MKPTQEHLEDQLLDALLHEQNRSDKEITLQRIENALDAGPLPVSRSPWPRRLATIAACLTLGWLLVIGAGWIGKVEQPIILVAQKTTAAESEASRVKMAYALNLAIRDQEDKVEERRKLLATIARTKNLIDTERDLTTNGSTEVFQDTSANEGGKKTYIELDAEKLQLESQITSLLKYDSDQLMVYAAGLDIHDNIIKKLYPQCLEQKRLIDSLKKNGLGIGDPAVLEANERLTELKGLLAEGVVNLRGNLQARLDTIVDQLKSVVIAKNDTREEAIKRGLDAQDFIDAKRDFENDQQVLSEMKLGRINQQLAGNVASHSKPAAPPKELAKNEASASTSAIQEQENKVEERRKTLTSIARTKGIIYGGTDSFYRTSGVDENQGASSAAALGELDGLPKGKGSGSGAGLGTAKSLAAKDVTNRLRQEESNTERYGILVDPTWQRPSDNPLSTFSIDVDNASYSNIRRMIRDGQTIPPDSVRIEECVNAFDYNYAKPTDDKAFAVHTTLATCPWNEQHLLMKIGIKGREISAQQRPVSNLVFLLDVSGSMQDPNKLPLVKESIKLLLNQLDERDSISYVVYAGSEGVVLPPTKMTESGRTLALEALAKLEAGGSTNGGSGIKCAYQIAKENFIKGSVNRVILATDGDFNVGVTDSKQLVQLVKDRAKDNIYLSVLAFGKGNLNDEMLEAISKDGNGNHYYIDSIREGRKVFLQRLSGTLITIAKDVKIQIEFNPLKVGSYRLIGYANRVLKNEDFNNDKVDAGDIGAGHTVTAFYEIVPSGAPQPNANGTDPLKYQQPAEKPAATATTPSDEWLTLKLRHKSPEGDISSLQETVVKGTAVRWQDADGDFTFASAVALFGMKLRGMDEAQDFTWSQIRELATPGLKDDRNENRAEFISLLNTLEKRSE